MANKLERSTRDPIHYPSPLRFARISGFSSALFLNSNHINFKNITGGDNEVGNGTYSSLRRPFRLEIVGLHRRNLRGKVRATMSDEAGGTVLDAGGPVHHLVGRKAHCGDDLGF